jgi:hypothetical protein
MAAASTGALGASVGSESEIGDGVACQAPEGRAGATPSRLALSRHRFAAYGLDRMAPARQGLAKAGKA